jgi:hypothetical protein
MIKRIEVTCGGCGEMAIISTSSPIDTFYLPPGKCRNCLRFSDGYRILLNEPAQTASEIADVLTATGMS